VSDTKDNGGTAFPVAGERIGATGMSLRDWFAGQAPMLPEDVELNKFECIVGRPYKAAFGSLEHWQFVADADAAWRLLHADAMLAARKGGSE
jgi:hypothetical protein